MDLVNKIIVLEGLDCSFKETNSKYIKTLLDSMNIKNVLYSFPMYESNSSFFIKEYLNGNLSKDPNDINPYQASLFYTLDRVHTYLTDIKKYYDDGYTIIFDRYMGSNCIYQSVKLDDYSKRLDFIQWILDLEINKLDLPKPDITLYMRTPYEVSMELMKNKEGADIHETNVEFQKRVYDNADFVCDVLQWTIINCTENNKLLSKEEIAEKIKTVLLSKSSIISI